MYKLTPDLKTRYQGYVNAAKGARDDLAFLLDNLGVSVDLDGSERCFVDLEELYWRIESGEIEFSEVLMSLDDFIALTCRYLGQCVIDQTGARWMQSREKNRRFAQPCIDGFGNKEWDRFYPIELAKNFHDLPISADVGHYLYVLTSLDTG